MSVGLQRRHCDRTQTRAVRRVWLLLTFCLAPSVHANDVSFNRDVRPILSDRCFSCHGPDQGNRKSNLRLDVEESAKAALKNGRTAIVAGNTASSELWKRITSKNAAQRMPPAYMGHPALSDAEVETLRQWITQGARYERHWSFLPPAKPNLPPVRDASWIQNPIDAFVLSRLEREGLTPSPTADRRTLIRRLTLDLTGLPPTPHEVEAFVADTAPGTYERLVDRLLASSAYSERMAVKWMEAARYADTNGYQTDGPRTMWRWRDWVIDAFRRDMPFDQFTIEQIAGDLLPTPTLDQQIATGFNRNHRTSAEGGSINEELRVEYVADRTETTSTIWLGLTVGCARCHDHKFDPISQRDYYSLYAFFNNVPERGFAFDYGNDKPLILAPLPEQQQKIAELRRQVAASESDWTRLESKIAKLQRKWEKTVVKQPSLSWEITSGLGVHFPERYEFDGKREVTGDTVPKLDFQDPFTFSAWIEPTEPTGAILSRGDDYAESEQHGLYMMKGKLRLHVMHRWTDHAMRLETAEPLQLNKRQHVALTYDGKLEASGVHIYIDGVERKKTVLFDQLLAPIRTTAPWRVGSGGGLRFHGAIEDTHVYTRALTPQETVSLATTNDLVSLAAIPPAQRTLQQQAKLRLAFLDKAAPADVRLARQKMEDSRKALDTFITSVPTTMVMDEQKLTRDTFVLQRGAYDAPGDSVSPAVPTVLPQLKPGDAPDRLRLARWLVDPANPLTARVTVNRLWAMLFGTGLVKSVDDFGAQGEWPTHPELLDWLAVDFMQSGWRLKHTLKTIVMSATYQQRSQVSPQLLQRDPENRLLARGSRFRLRAEMIRDSALFTSGLLVDQVGGPPAMPYQPAGLWQELTSGGAYKEDQGAGLYRRSLYTYWKRTVAPPNMVNFDAPTREVCTVREVRTNTPLQALNLMNDVAYVEAARKLGERMLLEGGGTRESRIQHGTQLVLARPPTVREQQTFSKVLQQFQTYYDSRPEEAARLLAQGRAPVSSSLAPSDAAAYALFGSLLLNLDEAMTRE